MLSHRAMYYGLLKGFPNLNVISEEDDPETIDMSTVEVPLKTEAGVDAIISDGDDVLVPIDEVDVWIDPLDATQEVSISNALSILRISSSRAQCNELFTFESNPSFYLIIPTLKNSTST